MSQNPDLSTYFHPACLRQPSISRSVSNDPDARFSDFESESSRDTVNEKHTTEDREKEKEDEEAEEERQKRKDEDLDGVRTRKRKTSQVKSEGVCSDLEQMGEDGALDEELPRKKRPPSSGSNILDDSLHMSDTGDGVDVSTLFTQVNTLKRRGLFSQYGSIKMEAPAGTFHNAK